jgi:hypothetical protein
LQALLGKSALLLYFFCLSDGASSSKKMAKPYPL